MKKYLLIFVGIVVGVGLSGGVMGQIFSVGGGGTLPTGWTAENNVTTNAIDQSSYYLVDAGTNSDKIITTNYDLSSYSTVTLNVDVASYGSGVYNGLKIEFSTNGGTSWSATTYTSAITTGSSYIVGGPINITQAFSSTTKFRFSNNGTSGRGVRIQKLILTGTADGPTITSSPTSLTGFTYVAGSGPSTSQSFNISGSNLTGAPGNITITGSTNYEVSNNNSTWGASTTIAYASASLSATPVYVRLKTGLAVASYNENITYAGGGVSSSNFACSGSVTAPPSPTLTSSVSTLTGYTYVLGSGPSANQTFTISGSNLTGSGNITVTGSTNYLVSTDGTTFSASVTYAYAGGVITSQPKTVYVRLKAGLAVGNYNSENIAISGGGATGINVGCSGVVTSGSAANVFISEFAGAGYLNDFNDEYLELTNTGGASQDLTGWKLLYYNASSLEATISLTGSIAANSAYLIAVRNTAGTINGLTPNLAGDFAAMNSTGYVVLQNASSVIVDQAGSSSDKFSDNKNYEFTNCTGDNLPTSAWTDLGTGNGTPGVVNCIIAVPTLFSTQLTLSGFTYIEGNGPSTEQNFSLTGSILTGSDVILTPPTNFEISLNSGSGFQSTAITLSSFEGSSTPIYVRLKSGLIVNTYGPGNISIAGGGATTITVACSGSVTAAGAPISLAFQGFEVDPATPLDTWNYTSSGSITESSTKYYLGSRSGRIEAVGSITLNNIDISGYQDVILSVAFSCTGVDSGDDLFLDISYDNGSTWTGTGSVQLVDGFSNANIPFGSTNASNPTTVATNPWKVNIDNSETQISVRLRTVGCSGGEYYYIDNVEIVGSVNGPTIALTPTTLSDFTYIYGSGPSAEKTFKISGTSLTANISIAAPTNYEISTGTGGSFVATNPITLTQSGGNVAETTIYVRLKAGLAIGNYNSETIIASSTNATNKIVTCSGIVTASTTSTLSASATLTEPATNSSIADTPAEIFSVFDFTFTDDNGSGGDNIATKISQIVIKQGAGNDVADWTKVIAYAKLVDNNNKEQIGTVNTTDITFSSIPNNTGTPDDLGYIADNAGKTYTLKIYFKTDFGSEKTTIDGKNLVYLVDNSCFVFADPSSHLAAAQSVNSGATNNAISVIASKLLFSTNKPPATSITNTNTNVEVTATDENGNRDLGSSASITLSKVTGSGTVSSAAGLTKPLSSGIYSWTDVRFSSAGIYTITANDGGSLTDITSGNILITDAPTVIWSDNCNPEHIWDVDNGSANWINISPTSNPPAHNGNCYKTAAANTLYANSKEYILTSEVISLADYSNCQLSFWMWMESEATYDGGIVEVNSTSLGAWTKFNGDIAYDGNVSGLSTTAWYGAKTTWQKITIDLSTLDGQTNLQFRFRFKTDVSNNKYGWAVDEMQVTGIFSGCAGPSVQASNLSMTNIAGTTMDLNYTRGNGTGGVLVVARQGSAVNADPVSGTSYSSGNFGAGSQIGTGNWVVYNGSANSCTVAGLTSSTNYYFAIYEYNTAGTCYNRTELAGNATTICSTAINITAATATPASTIVYVGWTDPICYDEVMIIAKPSASISGTPSGDGSAYSAILNYGGAGTAFDGGKVVYKGPVSPQVVYGLTNGTLYYFKIFTRKGTTWSSGVEVSATPIAGTLAANGSGTATMTNGAIGNINGLDIWQRNKSSQIANFVITGVSGGWLQNVQIDLSTFSTNLLVNNVAISGNAQYAGTTITRTGEVLLINNLNLTNTNTLIVSISGLSTIDIIADTDLGNKTISVQTGNTAGSRSAIASSPVAYLTVPFANAKKYTDNGTTAILNYKGQTVAVEGISTIASGRLSTSEYDQFFIQEGDGSGAKGLCVRKGSAFSPGAQIAHFYIVKGPLDLISGGVTGQTDAYKNMTAINTPTHIVDLGAATLPTPYFVEIEALYAMSYSEFEEVDGLLMRIPSVEKASGTWPALGVASGNVRMKDYGATNNLRCYIFANTDVGGVEPTWPTNMATLVYNFDQNDNYKGRQITPVYKMNFFAEIIWNGSTGNGRWSDALNWSPNILPQQSDEVIFDNITGDANSYTVVYDVLTMQTIKSLRINPTSPNTITLNFPNTCTFSPAITINLSGDAVIIENGGVLNADFGSTSGDPLTLSASGTDGKLRINNGGRFIWKADQSNAYILDRISTVAGTEKGIFEFDIQSSASEPISFSNRTYGSLVLSASDGNNTYQIQGANNATIRGDFIINNNVTIDENWGTTYSGTINIGGNFTNNASAWNINSTVNSPSNLILLNGTAAQIISSASTTMNIPGTGFGKNIQISNTNGGVSLASDIKLNKNLTMTSGILNTGSYVIDLATTGTLIETPINPTSYITGNVRATRNIGSGSQTFGGIGLNLTESNGVNPTVVTRVTGTQLQGNASCCLGNWSIKRYFDIVPTSNTGLNASMEFSYFEHELQGVSETDLMFFKADLPFAGASPWTNMEGGAGNSTNNTVSISSLTGFSRWTVASKINPLPVELLSFTAKCDNNITELAWATASEINNDYFEVQKSSNGYSWNNIGIVKGAGNSSIFNSYTFADKGNSATAYYRLRQVDFDGKFEYSPIIVGNCDGNENIEIIIYPNPVTDILNISIGNWKTEKINWEIVNVTGQTVLNGVIYSNDAFATEQINISSVNPGMYLIRFGDNSKMFIRKIDKK